jgi:GNAT superfamily N-acetyltransferase
MSQPSDGTAARARLEIVEAEAVHAAGIAAFIRAVWDPAATAGAVLQARRAAGARNVAEPGVAPPTWIAVQADRVLGYVTTIPIRLWDGQREWPAYWIKGLMVLPAFRNGPIGYLLVKAAVARLPRTGALAVAPPARRLFAALGYADLGAIPNFIQPLAPHRIAQRLNPRELGLSGLPRWLQRLWIVAQKTGMASVAGWAAGVTLRALNAAAEAILATPAAAPVEPKSIVGDLDALWTTIRAGFPAAVVRDSRYLMDRYPVGPEQPYVWLATREGGALTGIAVVRRPRTDVDARLRGLRVAVVADIVCAPSDVATGRGLLRAAERTARGMRADAILATWSAPAFLSFLRPLRYFRIPGNVHFLLRDATGEPIAPDNGLSGWWLTRGDGHADEVF